MGTLVASTPAATALEAQRRGMLALSLTNFANTSESQLVGTVEVNGSVYEFATAESATGWSGISDWTQAYIKLVPNVGAGTIAAEYTETAPTWDADKAGWYGTGANANHRYVAGVYRTAGAYGVKWLYLQIQDGSDNVRIYGQGNVKIDNSLEVDGTITGDLTGDVTGGIVAEGSAETINTKVFSIGDWDMNTDHEVTITHGVTNLHQKIRGISVMIRNDAGSVIVELTGQYYSDGSLGGQVTLDSTTIYLYRVTGGFFDSTTYDSTSFNRGWVTIWYAE